MGCNRGVIGVMVVVGWRKKRGSVVMIVSGLVWIGGGDDGEESIEE